MDQQKISASGGGQKQARIPTASEALDDGTILEMVYKPDIKQTAFVVWKEGQWRIEREFIVGNKRFIPYSSNNNLIKNNVLLFPSTAEEYGTEETLIKEIRNFIHRYVDVSPGFEKIASYYVLFSWIYDSFNELPYLRLRGDYGSGKTRFLLIVGSLCYKPIFASGASTISPIFHILDAFHGTLIIDEGDFRFSDEKADIVKILNNGNVKGIPILRSELSPTTKEYNPKAFHVFGPKIVATRGYYQDRALESRFITEETGTRKLREDIPINLPSIYKDEALRLRNKLLLFRLRNAGEKHSTEHLIDRSIEPRINQIFAPLLSIINDESLRSEIQTLARQYNSEMITERSMDIEAQVLEVIRDVLADTKNNQPSIKNITGLFAERFGQEYGIGITPKWIGGIIRRKLSIKTQKSHGVFIIPRTEQPKLALLYERYGIQ